MTAASSVGQVLNFSQRDGICYREIAKLAATSTGCTKVAGSGQVTGVVEIGQCGYDF